MEIIGSCVALPRNLDTGEGSVAFTSVVESVPREKVLMA